MQIASTYLEIAQRIADGTVEATVDTLEEYFTDDPVVASLRLWYFAAVGPILVAAALKKLNAEHLTRDGFWVIEQTGIEPDDDPSALVAAQCVAAHLNGDEAAAQDVTSANFAVVANQSGMSAAHDAMFDVVIHHLQMLAGLIQEGAFVQ
jgi:hypothetical protein